MSISQSQTVRSGQRKLARYRHTSSCMRVAGIAPGKERLRQEFRCRVMAAAAFLILLAGIIAVLF